MLLVEKDHILSDLIEYRIGSEHYIVFSTSDETYCCMEATHKFFNVIIVDVDSFGNKGIGLIGNLRDIQPETYIVAIVPPGKDNISMQAFQEGADHTIEKPIKTKYLKEYLSEKVKYVH